MTGSQSAAMQVKDTVESLSAALLATTATGLQSIAAWELNWAITAKASRYIMSGDCSTE